MDARVVISFLFLATCAAENGILFPSGKRLLPINSTDAKGDADEFVDVKKTGSWLFDIHVNDNLKKRLSLAVTVEWFRSQDSRYFRAHPVFIVCLQKVMNELQNADTPLRMYSGYKTKKDIGSSTSVEDLYARSGTGAQLGFRPSVKSADLKEIAKAMLKYCPPLFERIQQDIGIIMMSDRVHVHMTGVLDTQPLFSSKGFSEMNTAAFETWALDQINSGIDPKATPDCSSITGLVSGATHPTGFATPEEVVGVVDMAVTRDAVEDFKKLVQYLGTNVDFTNPEKTASWCGKAGNPCIDCTAKPAGNDLSKRCANRLMTARMYNVLKKLQKMTRDTLSTKLKVLKAFDEPYDGNTGYSASSLHAEGRQLTLQLVSSNTVANLQTVTKLAICLGADYVKHNGDHVLLAVKHQKGLVAQKVDFQGNELLVVEPPTNKTAMYKVMENFEGSDDDYPLFDSSNQEEILLAENTPLKLFKSSDSECRYFRLSPYIAKCYSLLVNQLNKWNADGDPVTGLGVHQGFMSSIEERANIDPFDERYNTFTLGTAMEVEYTANPKNLTIHHLVETVIDKCSPLFDEIREEIGIGLYKDWVFVDVRSAFEVWTDNTSLIPAEHANIQAYKAELEIRYDAAVDFRIVDPDDLEEAKTAANVPHRQSPFYNHTVPPHVLRRRRAAPDANDCVPKTDTAFCTKTKRHRDAAVDKIWIEVKRKHFYRQKEDVKAALYGCLGVCGTCTEGAIYESKLENCDNFIHWVFFRTLNEDGTVSNIFPRDNSDLRKGACRGHCIEHAPIFLLIVNELESVFRPDETKSVEEEVYSEADNPSPLMTLLHRLYAIHATGIAKIWVNENTDVDALRAPLEVMLLYNKNITEVDVYVSSPGSKDGVESALQNLKLELTTTGYPPYTREFLPKVTVKDRPTLKSKRGTEWDDTIGLQLIDNWRNQPYSWINKEL